MRRIRSTNIFTLGSLLVLILVCALCGHAANLVVNGGFEELNGVLPNLWATDVWLQGEDASRFTVEEGQAHTGGFALTIESFKPNDAKLVQNLRVKPNTVYKLSCWVKASGVGAVSKGANLTVIGILDTSRDVRDTLGQWEFVELYGRTGRQQREMAVTVRIGGYGSLNTGRASFDDVVVEEVKRVPPGTNVVSYFREEPRQPLHLPKIDFGPVLSSTWLILVFSLIFLLCFAGFHWVARRGGPTGGIAKKSPPYILLLLAALALRLILAASIQGHPIDIGCFKGWADSAARGGLTNFYSSGVFADYPPGYVYILYFLGKIRTLFALGFDSPVFLILLKLPAILADMATAYIIYRLASKRLNNWIAFGLAMLYAFNPAVIINSAVWGQVDAFFTLFVLLAVVFATEDRLPLASGLFAAALLIKPQALIFTPIWLLALIGKKDWKIAVQSVISGLAVLIVLTLPFLFKHGVPWLFTLYQSTMSQYPYASVNAYNLFALTGANWLADSAGFLALTFRHWGFIFIAAITLFAGFIFFRSKHESRLYYIGTFIIVAVFVLSSGMHERYLFPGLALAALGYVGTKDRRLLHVFGALSITQFINVGTVFALSLKKIYQVPSGDVVLLAVSVLNIAILIYLIKAGLDIYLKGQFQADTAAPPEAPRKSAALHTHVPGEEESLPAPAVAEEEQHIVYTRKDYFLMGALTFVYALVALFNLGSLKSPRTYWKPANAGKGFVADLGQSKQIDRVTFFAGLGQGRYRFDISDDNQTWRNCGMIQPSGVFTWNYVIVGTPARYMRIIAESPGAMLNEMGIFGPDKRLMEAESVKALNVTLLSEGSVQKVFDEPRTAAYAPSHLNGTYFDEIYFARTAYEHLHRIEPFESTHPPLGKVLISLGIAIFGMNPFGWRIIGTLFGIAMVPLMYVFAKRIFKESIYAFLAAFLMAFDFMHFTQTRIATIDVYAVFFTILMYYFMYKYYCLDFYRTPFRKALIPLALSGLFFGIGAACKWTSAYGGLGLALIFLVSLIRRFVEYRRARRVVDLARKQKVGRPALEQAKFISGAFPGKSLATLAWCLLFFILVPVVVYTLSYIPFMEVPGAGHGLAEVVSYQGHMYRYHSELKATHPFSSKWWEWPLLRRPIWYYQGIGDPAAGKISSIVLLGNPAVWWLGILAIFAALAAALAKKGDKSLFVLLVAFAAQYVPWILIPRLTFLYHFFTSLPFVILMIVYLFRQLMERNSQATRYVMYGYMGLVVLLFVMFYPVLSGSLVSKAYVGTFLRWFPGWYFYGG